MNDFFIYLSGIEMERIGYAFWDTFIFNADHSFIYILRDGKAGLLFVGRLNQ